MRNRTLRAAGRAVAEVDLKLVRRAAQLPRSGLDRAMLRLTRSANKSGLWWAVAAVLATRKGSTRRAAARGMAAIAGASATANLIGKPLMPRRRPAAAEMPLRRRLTKFPTSSSFPSGHAASAAAFATAVAMESPPAAAAVVPVAGAVAYSRVHTGVHWPTDVVAGALIGVGAAAATRHWWPRTKPETVETAPPAQAAAIPGGEGMLVLVNPGSGNGESPAEEVRSAWPEATLIAPDAEAGIRAQLTAEIRARGALVQALGVAGGDGTVAAVAAVAAAHGLPLAVVPTGTLNHFARDIGIGSLPEVVRSTEQGRAITIDLGEVRLGGDRDRWFVNTAGIGGYPEMVRVRQQLQQRHPKWPSAAVATARALRRATPLDVLLNGERKLIWALFVGNGAYTPKGFVPTGRATLDRGLLDVRYLRADLPYSRARFVLAVLTNTLHASHVYRQRDLPALDVELLDGHRRIALDGEVEPPYGTFRFRVRRRALVVYRG